MEIKCPKCGHVNTEEQIDHWPSGNEEGEDFYEFDLDCAGCDDVLFHGSDWGDYNQEDAVEQIEEHFAR